MNVAVIQIPEAAKKLHRELMNEWMNIKEAVKNLS